MFSEKNHGVKQDGYNDVAGERLYWKKKNRYYYRKLTELLKFIIPDNKNIVELGCGTGEILYELNPSSGIGVDSSENMLSIAKSQYGDKDNLTFILSDANSWAIDKKYQADFIVVSDLIGDLPDVWKTFRSLRNNCNQDTKVVITYFNALWEPILKVGEALGLKMPQNFQNWLSLRDIENLLMLNGFEVINQGRELLLPKDIPVISYFANRFLAKLPLLNKLNLVTYIVAQPAVEQEAVKVKEKSVTVLIPCRNEKGNIRSAIERLPEFGSHQEILFVDGNSNDGTVEEIEKIIEEYRGVKDIKLLHQLNPGDTDGDGHGKMLKLGKGDAVRKGFDAAEGEILMILDADLTVIPEELPMFYHAIVEGRGRFINGTRLVYPMEQDAMRALNKLANHFFGLLFSWLLGQRIKDTLCGTKVLYKKDYLDIAANREFFGDFDPFGDFDLLFGAAKNNLKIVEVPVHYAERTYGEIKIERFRHGVLLFKMSWIAMKKLKFR